MMHAYLISVGSKGWSNRNRPPQILSLVQRLRAKMLVFRAVWGLQGMMMPLKAITESALSGLMIGQMRWRASISKMCLWHDNGVALQICASSWRHRMHDSPDISLTYSCFEQAAVDPQERTRQTHKFNEASKSTLIHQPQYCLDIHRAPTVTRHALWRAYVFGQVRYHIAYVDLQDITHQRLPHRDQTSPQ